MIYIYASHWKVDFSVSNLKLTKLLIYNLLIRHFIFDKQAKKVKIKFKQILPQVSGSAR